MNEQLLIDKIEKSGFSKSFIAESLGLSRPWLYNKLSGKREFKASEIKRLSKLLNLSASEKDAIFFANAVD